MKLHLFIAFVFSFLAGWSQDNSNDVSMWSGTIDGIHPIELMLQQEAQMTTGKLTLLSSGKTFLLEGKKEGQGWKLDEIDENFKVSGQLTLNYTQNKLDGIWSNHTGDLFLRIELTPRSKQKRNFECSEENWTKTFVGSFEKSLVKTVIRKENNAQVYVEVYFDDIPIEGKLNCLTKSCNNFEFTSKQLHHLFNSLEFRLNKKNELFAFINRANKKTQIRMVQQTSIAYVCDSYADYSRRIDFVIPNTSNDAFNAFLKSTIDRFRKQQNYVLAQNNNIENPSSRFQITSSIWTDIHYFSSRYISGTITDQNSIANKNQRVSFIFDLKENKLIEPSTLFNKQKNFSKQVESFLLEQKKLYISLNEKYIKDWAQKQDFEFITINKNGFLLNSNFHNVYGERQLVLPFETVQKQLKKDFKKEMKIQ